MALQCGIIGITNVGKSTLFNCMSNTKVETTNFAFSSSKSNIGIINVPDNRLFELEKLQATEKLVPATVEILDIPGLTKGANQGEGVGNKFLADIRNTDALIHVLRCFDDPNLAHIDGSVDPVRDIETINLELQVKDLESVEKKIQRLEKLLKIGEKDAKHGIDVLTGLKNHLESMQNARNYSISETDKKFIDDLFLLTIKPVIYVCNVDDKSAINGNAYVEKVRESLKNEETEIIVIAGKLEAEIADLEDLNDRKVFLEDAGLKEPGVNKLIRSAYSLLNLMSFFTVGPKEIRAWTIKKGMTAPQAAGSIHSDLERGFIRAEVMKYTDFITIGSEHKVKEAGKFHVEGKNYIVDDGDILHIRFNV
ncbi:MAG: redox-regulated ATPase YchF [Bacteroidetes bacterium GWC2_33_15]|nr:MAG: redox-regulated ATPase YchF [Bacteroidetes bacterium GWA2_33_15]OFX51710.1 MAG: redox-regulated ATPase YchF [Bacteroidetes bacterium GWC2_33_15]OFX66229.1 MAG: redox-regulated ATPase YchF [Bacteroidetes bacterium GWB2_32_14]OFX67010.1 MAG: redox-regulated ATPase YchF [Bacteroidetes bacterium GWD2_33_33]HAN17712.1 redox-regulated ATPase YchF [Bacteroidales bacterium]